MALFIARAGGWRGGFILSALELWLKEDMLKSLKVLAGLDLLIEVFGVNWSYLYLQVINTVMLLKNQEER